LSCQPLFQIIFVKAFALPDLSGSCFAAFPSGGAHYREFHFWRNPFFNIFWKKSAFAENCIIKAKGEYKNSPFGHKTLTFR
jgi:hypothetical protein